MDPLWAWVAEFWWIVPVASGAAVFAMLGLHYQRAVDARRIEYDAARLELRDARAHAWSARSAARLARAELTHVQAERAASRATPGDVAEARRRAQDAQRVVRATAAEVRVRRLRVSAARAGVAAATDPEHRPLARLMAAHDDVTGRWLAYETDPARLLMFPLMSDGRVPTTAAYLTARAEAQQLRPTSPRARITPAQFAAYRNAVERLTRTFDLAEQAAWREARQSGMVPPEPRAEASAPWANTQWATAAQQFLERSSSFLAWASENAAALGFRPMDASSRAEPGASTASPAPSAAPSPSPAPAPAPESVRVVWPVPSRTPNSRAS